MNIVVLVDNTPHPEEALCFEHGLCFYCELNGLRWLFDLGASDKFAQNAQKLGIDLNDIDFVVLSHAHKDHTGGLEKFFSINQKAKIYLSEQVIGQSFFSTRQENDRNIGVNQDLFKQHRHRVEFIGDTKQITNTILLFGNIPTPFDKPLANKWLYTSDSMDKKPDLFSHELYMCVKTERGNILFSGCSHNGLMNIALACSEIDNENPIIACIGGTHLLDINKTKTYDSEQQIIDIGEFLLREHPQLSLISGHCTGKKAFSILKQTMGEKLLPFYTGAKFQF